MSGVYVLSEDPRLAAELVGFGKSAGKETHAVVFDEEEATSLAECGADSILCLDGDASVIENNAKALASMLRDAEADLFLVGATQHGRDIAARVAGYGDFPMAADVTELSLEDGEIKVTRMMYGGAVASRQVLPMPSVVTVGAGHFAPMAGTSPVDRRSIQADTRVSLVSVEPLVKEGADLATADRIIAVGMGLDSKDDMVMAEELAETMGAELGCTRGIAEERKWLPIEQYVGLSGVSVAPDLYLTLGVSGQVQHVAGIRDAKIIVAIDKNIDAPIFKACDYGIVGDLHDIVPLLQSELS